MTSAEHNSEDWRETRARADSVASAVFLISGGALSLSITVILGNKASGLITPEVASLAAWSWYCLLIAVVMFLLLKGHMILQAHLLQFRPDFLNKHLALLNCTAWAIGLLGFIPFVVGMTLMVRGAAIAVGA